MPILKDTYNTSGLFKNGQFNTIATYILRNAPTFPFKRVRLETPDDDFLDIDTIQNNKRKAVFLFHGLEGSTDSQYMRGAARIFLDHNWDIIATNYRGCSGVMNRYLHSYHSGKTDDVNLIINHFIDAYDQVVLIGFSLGGNLIMKYNGDHQYPLNPKIKATLSISAPIDLYGGVKEIASFKNIIYEKRFLKTLVKKAKEKLQVFDHEVDPLIFRKIKSLFDFDDYFTGPVNGFKGAIDYYSQCNSLQHLSTLRIPALLLNASDDPFLPDSCYPENEAKTNKNLFLLTSKYGGHVGFYTKGKSYYWSEITMLEFSENQIK